MLLTQHLGVHPANTGKKEPLDLVTAQFDFSHVS